MKKTSLTKLQLKNRREALGLTQEELGKLLHEKTKQTIYRWEKGVRKIPAWVDDKLQSIEDGRKISQ